MCVTSTPPPPPPPRRRPPRPLATRPPSWAPPCRNRYWLFVCTHALIGSRLRAFVFLQPSSQAKCPGKQTAERRQDRQWTCSIDSYKQRLCMPACRIHCNPCVIYTCPHADMIANKPTHAPGNRELICGCGARFWQQYCLINLSSSMLPFTPKHHHGPSPLLEQKAVRCVHMFEISNVCMVHA